MREKINLDLLTEDELFTYKMTVDVRKVSINYHLLRHKWMVLKMLFGYRRNNITFEFMGEYIDKLYRIKKKLGI